MTSNPSQNTGLEIAVIGMAGRFPGAPSLDRYWENLINAHESLIPISDKHLREQGVSEEDLKDPTYIKIGGLLEDADQFDATFFGYNPREAEILDPQQRVFLECSWQAMETAGYLGDQDAPSVGVFAGAGMNGYLLNLYSNSDIRKTTSPYEIFIGNDKDFLATRVSYKLNLCGPSLSIQSACSSSLVAIHTACQSLLSGECDLALAGGVAISKQLGYRAQQGNIYSPDGHCRSFDAHASGTVAGNGVGVVVLKRLDDALRDGDAIDAVIKGSAVTNDGAHKVSYTAPQVDSQAAAVRNALAIAEVPAESISYIEAHGTGTPMGDPIEIAALTQAFREQTEKRQFCSLGSVKSNIGHLDAAAGIAGFIKTVLALKNRKIPATLHFEKPNPEIDFKSSPFQVNAQLTDWESTTSPRRAGVSSFGIGGTNAHMILEEAPPTPSPDANENTAQLLPISAKSPKALKELVTLVRQHLQAQPNTPIHHAAFTLQEGRRHLPYRTSIVAQDITQAVDELAQFANASAADENPSLVLLFPGQGSHTESLHPSLTEIAPLCEKALAQCNESESLTRECLQLFSQQYSLAKLILDLGIKPAGLLGHSLGEIAAACIAGLFSLQDALDLIALRSRLMEAAVPGAMIAVGSSPEKLSSLLTTELSLAAHNAPEWVTISGSIDAISILEQNLKTEQIPSRRLPATRAFHSPSMDEVATEVRKKLTQISLSPPSLPIISSLTGTWLRDDEATNPDYWARQIRETVDFNQASTVARQLPETVFLELGSSSTLTNLVKQHGSLKDLAIADQETRLHLAAKLWTSGFQFPWSTVREKESACRIPLPTTSFQRSRFWVKAHFLAAPEKLVDTPENFLYQPSWKRLISLPALTKPVKCQRWLIFANSNKTSLTLAEKLEQAGENVIIVEPGKEYTSAGFRRFTVNPSDQSSFRTLFKELTNRETSPEHIVFLWDDLAALQNLVLTLNGKIRLSVVTTNQEEVLGSEALSYETPPLGTLSLVLAQEFPDISCRTIDLGEDSKPSHLLDELRHTQSPRKVALRGVFRWKQNFEILPKSQGELPSGKTYFLIGDLSSGLAKIWAQELHKSDITKIAILNTNPEIDPTQWVANFEPFWHATAHSLDQLSENFESATQSCGHPNGIFFCSPTTNQQSAAPITLLTEAHWQYNHQTKAGLILALDELLMESQPDFICVQSSLSATLGGIGLGAYAAANAQLDRLVIERNRRDNTRWLSINWDRVESVDPEPSAPRFGGDNEPALSADEAWTITTQAITQNLSGILVTSPTSLPDRLDHWVENSAHSSTEKQPTGTSEHSRPNLPNDYLAPRTKVEKTIITIWEEFLGMQGIGVEDNFFALGGHSLLAIQIIARLRETFPLEIELRHLVSDNPTPASMAAILEADLPDEEQLEDISSILEEIQELSPEETLAQLNKRSKS